MKVTVILIVIVVLTTVTKGLVKELEEQEIRTRVETIKTTAFMRSDKTLRRVLNLKRLALIQTLVMLV